MFINIQIVFHPHPDLWNCLVICGSGVYTTAHLSICSPLGPSLVQNIVMRFVSFVQVVPLSTLVSQSVLRSLTFGLLALSLMRWCGLAGQMYVSGWCNREERRKTALDCLAELYEEAVNFLLLEKRLQKRLCWVFRDKWGSWFGVVTGGCSDSVWRGILASTWDFASPEACGY